jgi:hypothetical protein
MTPRIEGFDHIHLYVGDRAKAALMGGDTVVAETGVKEGRQEFGVYLCEKGAAE